MGKTSICHQLATDGTDFPKNYIMTTFSDIQVKSVKIPDTNDVVELFLVDSSGKEYYQDLLKESWSQANMIVAVYDCTREESFGNVTKVSNIDFCYLLLCKYVVDFCFASGWIWLLNARNQMTKVKTTMPNYLVS